MEPIKIDLSTEEKLSLIKFFYLAYGNTDQHTDDFSTEFYFLLGDIFQGYLPLQLDFLTDYEEDLVKEFPRFKKYFNKLI